MLFFTTGQVAACLKISQQTVIRHFDAGKIKGRRDVKVPGKPPVLGPRIIPRENLVSYMRKYDYDKELLETYEGMNNTIDNPPADPAVEPEQEAA